MDIVEKASELLVKNLSREQNILKVVEECAELQEVMIKYLTKSESLRPKMEKLTEEMGDVIFRIVVASKMLGIEDQVQERLEHKAQIMNDWAIEKFK